MAGPIRTMSQATRFILLAVTGQKHSSCETAAPAVILHDPAAQRPRNLDDPFFDPKVQTRIADVIANGAKNK
jgi:hypothetical protein